MIPFSGNPLDRAGEKRTDAVWIAERQRDSASLILPLWRGQVFVLAGQGGTLEAGFLRPGLCESLAADAVCIFLGLEDGHAVFALDISAAEDPANNGVLAGLGEFRELRGAAQLLPIKDLAIVGQAKALIDWHQRHGFCAKCGKPSVVADAGYKRVCPACGTEHFPRTDPVVIMLATHGDACLLGNGAKWPPEFYSALAGFAEPGETIEEAVRRELFEETGIDVADVGDVITTIESDYISRDRHYQQTDHFFSVRVNEVEIAIDVPVYPAFLGYAWWDIADAVSSGLRLFPEQLPEIMRTLLA